MIDQLIDEAATDLAQRWTRLLSVFDEVEEGYQRVAKLAGGAVSGEVAAPSAIWRDTEPAWMVQAACRSVAGDWVSIPKTRLSEQRIVKRVELAVCAKCAVRGDCLSYASESGQDLGIWGGLLPMERRRTR